MRYVLESAYTRFLSSQTEMGFERLALGADIEFDGSAHDIWAAGAGCRGTSSAGASLVVRLVSPSASNAAGPERVFICL